MSTEVNPLLQKRGNPSLKIPPGPNQAVINWKEDKLNNLVQNFGFSSDWGGNFHLPMSKFIGEVLTDYGLHISQINALGLPRITHVVFICRAQCIEPTFEKFNIFYFVTYTGGFYSFNSRTSGVRPCNRDPPESLHDWKQKLFYIRRGVIPIDMHYRANSEGVPRVNVSISYTDQDWALVAAGMSTLWVPQNPRAYPVYGYKGKAGYSLMNVFDPNVGDAMVVVVLPEDRPVWVDQIRDNFLHPSSESMATYANDVLDDDGEDATNLDIAPTWEELILLSSEESASLSQDLIHHSSRAGPQRGATREPAGEGVSNPVVDPKVAAAKQRETRKKKKEDRTEEKTTEEPVAEPTRKRPSNASVLDYVVVSETLSGLDAGVKRPSRDPDDDATLTEMIKKRKVLEDKKCELDAQAAALLSEKKSKFMGETVSLFESEIDLGVFSKKSGNRLETDDCFLFTAVSSKSARYGDKIDVSKITPPMSPPSKPLDLSPPNPDPKGKGKEDGVEGDKTEKVVENVVVGVEVELGGAHVECVETDWDSSEAT
ncbi:hypothetical protein Hanom_Chr06g00522771 [Helianthus anomalus]